MNNSVIIRMLLVIILGTLGTNHIYAFKELESYELPSSLALYASKDKPYKIWHLIYKFEVPYHFIEERFTKIRYGADLGFKTNLTKEVYWILGGYVRFIWPIQKSFYVKSEIGVQFYQDDGSIPLIAHIGFIYYPIKWIGLEFDLSKRLLKYDNEELVLNKDKPTWRAGFQILF